MGDISKRRQVVKCWMCPEFCWRRFLLAAHSSTDGRAQARSRANLATSLPALEHLRSGNDSDGTQTVPRPPPPRLAPHRWQGQRSLCVVGFVWAKEPRPNPLASLASPWHKAMGTLGEDSSILLAHSLLSWSPGTLTHPRKCTGAFVSSLYFSLRLLRLAEKQEKHHSLCQKVPQMNIFYLVPVFVIYSFIFPCSQKETFLRLPYLVLFYFKWESLSIKGRGKSPSVPFSSKQFGPSLF